MPFTVTMPKLSPTMEEGTIVKWHKKEGDFVQEEEVIIEVATDKATVEHSAIDKGFLRRILVKEGSSATVNQAIAIFTAKADESIEGYVPEGSKKEEVVAQKESGSAPVSTPKAASTATMAQPSFAPPPPLTQYEFEWPISSEDSFASPLARKMAKEKNLDLRSVKGSGPNGRIVEKDLEKALPLGVVTFHQREKPEIIPGTYHEEALSPMRKVIGDRLQASKTFIPHFYIEQQVDASALVETRNQLKEANISLTFNDFVVRAVALSLRRFPDMNSGFNSNTQSIVKFDTVDISIAVSIDGGLITPIVRHADFKNVAQLSKEVKELAAIAKKGKLKPEQYVGGSFTISNLGMYGVDSFLAIINPPQAAILAVGGILDQPVVKNNIVVPGKVLRLTLSVDHRVIDGSLAAQFINQVKFLLERPSLLLI